MRILLLYGTDGSDIRTVKLCRSLSRQGHEVHFVGWHRLDGAAN
jgi:UDP:flavonoid glycosyltransferase YjiC (YdhE family)